MQKLFIVLGIFFVLLLGISVIPSCVVITPDDGNNEVYTNTQPPEPQYEQVPPPPGERHVWVQGHWHWNGHRYVWIPGHYKQIPGQYHNWVPGHWEQRHGNWVWIPGYWQ